MPAGFWRGCPTITFLKPHRGNYGIKKQNPIDHLPGFTGRKPAGTPLCLKKILFQGRPGGSHSALLPLVLRPWVCPKTYDEVDPAFGTWDDVEKIGHDFDLVIDFMVNHISRQSIFFQDYLEKGPLSEYADMFLSFDKLVPGGFIPDEDLEKVYTRKPRPPYQQLERPNGTLEKIWCTFDYEQIDLDYDSPKPERS